MQKFAIILMQVLVGTYLFIGGLFDLYFMYLWVLPPNASHAFVPVTIRLFQLGIYGWIWTSLKGLVWPLFVWVF